MSDIPQWFEQVSIPALLRHARTTYGSAIRAALAEAGHDDIPKNGLYVIGGMSRGADGLPLAELIQDLRISKQAAGQLVDVLVVRGYLERAVDPHDRRRLTVALTARGQLAAGIQKQAIAAIDAQLRERIGDKGEAVLRGALAAVIGIGRQREQPATDQHQGAQA